MLTGHGSFRAYTKRIGKSNGDRGINFGHIIVRCDRRERHTFKVERKMEDRINSGNAIDKSTSVKRNLGKPTGVEITSKGIQFSDGSLTDPDDAKKSLRPKGDLHWTRTN